MKSAIQCLLKLTFQLTAERLMAIKTQNLNEIASDLQPKRLFYHKLLQKEAKTCLDRKISQSRYDPVETRHKFKFVMYAEGSSSADINPKSYHLTASEQLNPLLYLTFPSFECKFFIEKLLVYFAIVCCVVIS